MKKLKMRKVQLKSWNQAVLEFGLDKDGYLNLSSSTTFFSKYKDSIIPFHRIIEIDEKNRFSEKNIGGDTYFYVPEEMILGDYIPQLSLIHI